MQIARDVKEFQGGAKVGNRSRIEDQSSWGRSSEEVTLSEANRYDPGRSRVVERSEANHYNPGRSGVAERSHANHLGRSGVVERSEANHPGRSGVAEQSEANHQGRSKAIESVGSILNTRNLPDPNKRGWPDSNRRGLPDSHRRGLLDSNDLTVKMVSQSLRWTSEQKKGLAVLDTPAEGRELFEALKDIEDHLLRAYDSRKEVTKMLEANKIQEEWKSLEEELPPPKPLDLNWRTVLIHFGVNYVNETSESYGRSNMIDKSALHHMGFQHGPNGWLFKDEYVGEEEVAIGSSTTPYRPRSEFEKHVVRQLHSLTIPYQTTRQDVMEMKKHLNMDDSYEKSEASEESGEEESTVEEIEEDEVSERDSVVEESVSDMLISNLKKKKNKKSI
ncbi:hypothetical protein LR48_Vigan02g052900 [Vigna angularis]|uniref:Uncharacterized protein n=1 Tax=Phaseolus angularis TaxID=3914 RepID=A0A0L9TW20_PHAAN|nr:hypothetical protein LR48_Vigan02g052900 [Vigna angularis]